MAVTYSPKENNLVWAHFKTVGSAPDGSSNEAHTAPSYTLTIPDKGGIVKEGNDYSVAKVSVDVALDNVNTWVLQGKETDKLLAHEKRHWMMDIIVAYEMESAILSLNSSNPKTLKQKIKNEFEWHRKEREKWLSDKYDSETKHGTDKTAQAKWNKNVDQWFSVKNIPLEGPSR